MKIHEYQAKQIIASYGVKIPQGNVARTLDEVENAFKRLAKKVVVVKAQIHAGGRGKGGGVKLSHSLDELKTNARQILGMQLITPQTGDEGQKVKSLLIEEGLDILKELYFSILIDRSTQLPILLASLEGGMDIEEVADKHPEKIHREFINPAFGLPAFQALRLGFKLGLHKIHPKLPIKAAKFFMGIYQAFDKEDASLIEINPMLITKDYDVLALDCKITLDDNSLFRHQTNSELRDLDEEDSTEIEASKYELSYIKLAGSIGCMVNGAGLAMATMDIIKFHGGNPANFLDVGGGATQERVEAALELICRDKNVACVFINIFGGIVRCDMIAKGIVGALNSLDLTIPIIVRLRGNNASEAKKIIENSKFADRLKMIEDLTEAAKASIMWANR
ncbi:MAG: ADP-forming succinate--CoA ligase subunit beta [SAR324 cluster bacterium]|nr:ADP-forming succinate--CoA ligase subunit beta [SAR324 cluster bacterium]